jgi:hypothetical protein
MIQMVFLAIVDRNGLTIVVVNAPFALKRGGASPAALVCLSIVSKSTAFSQ